MWYWQKQNKNNRSDTAQNTEPLHSCRDTLVAAKSGWELFWSLSPSCCCRCEF